MASTTASELPTQDGVLLPELVDDRLLFSVDPAREDKQEELEKCDIWFHEPRIASGWDGGKGMMLGMMPSLWAQMLGPEQVTAALESNVVVGGSSFGTRRGNDNLRMSLGTGRLQPTSLRAPMKASRSCPVSSRPTETRSRWLEIPALSAQSSSL